MFSLKEISFPSFVETNVESICYFNYFTMKPTARRLPYNPLKISNDPRYADTLESQIKMIWKLYTNNLFEAEMNNRYNIKSKKMYNDFCQKYKDFENINKVKKYQSKDKNIGINAHFCGDLLCKTSNDAPLSLTIKINETKNNQDWIDSANWYNDFDSMLDSNLITKKQLFNKVVDYCVKAELGQDKFKQYRSIVKLKQLKKAGDSIGSFVGFEFEFEFEDMRIANKFALWNSITKLLEKENAILKQELRKMIIDEQATCQIDGQTMNFVEFVVKRCNSSSSSNHKNNKDLQTMFVCGMGDKSLNIDQRIDKLKRLYKNHVQTKIEKQEQAKQDEQNKHQEKDFDNVGLSEYSIPANYGYVALGDADKNRSIHTIPLLELLCRRWVLKTHQRFDEKNTIKETHRDTRSQSSRSGVWSYSSEEDDEMDIFAKTKKKRNGKENDNNSNGNNNNDNFNSCGGSRKRIARFFENNGHDSLFLFQVFDLFIKNYNLMIDKNLNKNETNPRVQYTDEYDSWGDYYYDRNFHILEDVRQIKRKKQKRKLKSVRLRKAAKERYAKAKGNNNNSNTTNNGANTTTNRRRRLGRYRRWDPEAIKQLEKDFSSDGSVTEEENDFMQDFLDNSRRHNEACVSTPWRNRWGIGQGDDMPGYRNKIFIYYSKYYLQFLLNFETCKKGSLSSMGISRDLRVYLCRMFILTWINDIVFNLQSLKNEREDKIGATIIRNGVRRSKRLKENFNKKFSVYCCDNEMIANLSNLFDIIVVFNKHILYQDYKNRRLLNTNVDDSHYKENEINEVLKLDCSDRMTDGVKCIAGILLYPMNKDINLFDVLVERLNGFQSLNSNKTDLDTNNINDEDKDEIDDEDGNSSDDYDSNGNDDSNNINETTINNESDDENDDDENANVNVNESDNCTTAENTDDKIKTDEKESDANGNNNSDGELKIDVGEQSLGSIICQALDTYWVQTMLSSCIESKRNDSYALYFTNSTRYIPETTKSECFRRVFKSIGSDGYYCSDSIGTVLEKAMTIKHGDGKFRPVFCWINAICDAVLPKEMNSLLVRNKRT